MTFWRRSSFGEAKLDFVKSGVSCKRELDFQGPEGSRGGQNMVFFGIFFEVFFGTFFNIFLVYFLIILDSFW